MLLSILNSDNIRVSALHVPVFKRGVSHGGAGGSRGRAGRSPRRDPGLPDGAPAAADARLPASPRAASGMPARRRRRWPWRWRPRPGPGWRCAGASREEMFGLLRQWQALESRAAAAKLGVLRALIRDDDQPLPGGGYHGDLPEGWTRSLTHEVALALAMPAVSAERLMWLAWDLEGRLPGIGGLLAAGKLTTSKAQAVDEALQQLSSQDAAAAEALILAELPGKTYGQVGQARRPGGGHRRPGLGSPAPPGRRAEQVPGGDVPRGCPARRAWPAGNCPPTRPWPPTPASAPARRSTKNPARSPAARGWTSTAPRLTLTCSTGSPPGRGSPPGCCPAPARPGPAREAGRRREGLRLP